MGGGDQTDCDDNCQFVANTNQVDIDDDSIGNACDPDIDGDTVLNDDDNCIYLPNPLQENFDLDTYGPPPDGDEYGDVCDADKDNDGFLDMYDQDACPYDRNCH